MAKSVSIQYRHLKTDDVGEHFDLKSVVVDVLTRSTPEGRTPAQNAKLRKIDLDQDGSIVILNKISSPSTFGGPVFAGQLIQLEPGALLPAVTQSLEADTEEFLLENLTLAEGTQILKGALYFAVVGNHVGLIEGHSVKGRTLERYLTRLLQDAGELETGDPIILNAKFASANGKALQTPTEVTVRAAPARRPPVSAKSQIEEVLEKEALRAREAGHTVFDVLATLGWDELAIERLKKDIPEGGWIEGFFRVFIKLKRRKTPFSRATIDEALRNVDPTDLGLKGDGSEKGGFVKLSCAKLVETTGQLLDPNHAMLQIIEALKDWASAGKIDCRFDTGK